MGEDGCNPPFGKVVGCIPLLHTSWTSLLALQGSSMLPQALSMGYLGCHGKPTDLHRYSKCCYTLPFVLGKELKERKTEKQGNFPHGLIFKAKTHYSFRNIRKSIYLYFPQGFTLNNLLLSKKSSQNMTTPNPIKHTPNTSPGQPWPAVYQ